MASRRNYVARHRHGRPGSFDVTVLLATWPPLRPLRRRWFVRRVASPTRPSGAVLPMPVSGVLAQRAA